MPRCRLFASMMAADYRNFEADLRAVTEAGVDGLHFDVMDGHFVPNITFGADLIRGLRPRTELPFDVHLMVTERDLMAEQVIAAGADRVSIHPEVGGDLPGALARIRARGAQPGLALSPGTPLEMVEWVLDRIDYLLFMSVNPGFSGQEFIPASKRKLARLSQMIRASGRSIRVMVDGGVARGNIRELAALGADDFIAGGAIFYHRPPTGRAQAAAQRVRELREVLP